MKILGKVSLFIGLLLLLSACQTNNLKNITTPIGQEPIRTIPVDVQSKYINVQALEPQTVDIASGNLFANGGFENGLEGWSACSDGAIISSTDAYEGSGALEVVPNNCFYKSTEVSSGQDLILSCYAKIKEGSGWTGMGLGFADSNWSTIDVDVPSTVITGTNYARYDVKFTAPTNSKYASMWLYSENKAVIDNCSLMLESEPPPPVPSNGNLLENGEFEITTITPPSALTLPTEWVRGCNNGANSTRGRDGRGVNIRFGTCIDQSLNAEDIAALSGNDYIYSCYVRTPEVRSAYTSMSIFFDGISTSVEIPASNSFQRIELRGTAPQATNGFVSIYSDGFAVIDQCSLTVGNTLPPTPPSNGDNNLLQFGTFTAFQSNDTTKPVNWTAGCNGIYERVADGRNGSGMRVSDGTCVDQPVNFSLISGRSYTFSCYAKNTGGYASMSIFFNDAPVSTVIPQSNDFQLVEITGVAPTTSTSNSFVSIYSESSLIVDDCSLEVEGSNLTGNPSIDVRNNVEGPDRYSVSGPYTFEVSVRNNGDIPLVSINLQSNILSCETNFPTLAVGETKTASSTADGRNVTDSDESGYRPITRAASVSQINVSLVTDNRVVSAGSDVTFFVNVGNGSERTIGPVQEIISNVPDCARQLTTNLNSGEIISYECVATNVQQGFVAMISATTVGPFPRSFTVTGEDSAEIVIEDTVSVDIRINEEGDDIVNVGTFANPEPYVFTAIVRNDGAVSLTTIDVASTVIQDCVRSITNLAPGESTSYTCTAPVLTPGQQINQILSAVATLSDGRQTTDSEGTLIYRGRDIAFDISLGAEGVDVVNVASGESLDIAITLSNTGFIDLNSIQGLNVSRPTGVFSFDRTICQDFLPTSGIDNIVESNIAFDLPAGTTKTFNCTLENITEDLDLTLSASLSNTNLLPSPFGESDQLLIKVD